MLRQAKEEDLKFIKNIVNQNREFFGFVMNVALLESIKNNSLYVFEKDNEISGFINYHLRKDGWTTIYEIAVGKDFHNQGIGKKLLSLLKDPIRLKTTADNINAISFYKKQGFSLIKKEQGRKRELLVFEKNELSLDLNEKHILSEILPKKSKTTKKLMNK